MQNVRVKEVKGPLGKGEKKFYAVVDEKGAEFTTFDSKISQVTPGSLLGIEVKVEGKYLNITEWKILEEGHTKNGERSGMTPEAWAEKDKIERASYEAQTAFKGIVELAKQGIVDKHFQELYDVALRWADLKLRGNMKPLSQPQGQEKPAPKPESPKPIIDLGWLTDSLNTLQTRDPRNWNSEAILTYMVGTYKVDGASVNEVATKLDKSKAAHFVKKVQEALDGM